MFKDSQEDINRYLAALGMLMSDTCYMHCVHYDSAVIFSQESIRYMATHVWPKENIVIPFLLLYMTW